MTKPLRGIIWDPTYACPYRCIHCYSESGRRPARQRSEEEMRRIIDAFLSVGPHSISIAGGEPLVLKNLPDLVSQVTAAGVAVSINTSGWGMTAELAGRLLSAGASVRVSLDASTPETNDRIRGRAGAFEVATRALQILSKELMSLGSVARRPGFAIDATIIRSNVSDVEAMARLIPVRFPGIQEIYFNAAAPSGLASEADFANRELLTDEQARWLCSSQTLSRLRRLVPKGVDVWASDNSAFRMRPEDFSDGTAADELIHVEPDGGVHLLAAYEGIAGNVLEEPLIDIWARVQRAHEDPFVRSVLSGVETRVEWARAARAISWHFAPAREQARLAARLSPLPSGGQAET